MFVDLSGFCVVIIKKGFGNECVCFVIVIVCFFIILSNEDCVFGIVWLILFINMIFVKMGFNFVLKFDFFILKYLRLIIFLGKVFVVNCIFWNLVFIFLVKFFVNVVFFVLGIFFNKMCFFVIRVIVVSLIDLFFFIIIFEILLVIFFNVFIYYLLFFNYLKIKNIFFLNFNM